MITVPQMVQQRTAHASIHVGSLTLLLMGIELAGQAILPVGSRSLDDCRVADADQLVQVRRVA
jgi:hypothetical protein